MNSRNFGNEPPPPSLVEGGNGNDDGGAVVGNSNFHLTRQSSIYSLTFDELQNTMGGIGKDFGSMNMDELLKNLWNAEETQQTMGYSGGGGAQLGGAVPGAHLQRQGSLTLPRTLSQKTVDEVWKNISKEDGGGKDGSNDLNVNFPQAPRQQTLGGMTLEEFLFRAGVVREDTQLGAKPINNMNPLGVGFQQIDRSSGLMGNRISESNNQITMQSLNSPFNLNGSRSSQQQQLLPQQTTATFASSMALPTSDQLGSPGIKRGLAGLSDQVMNSNLQGGGIGMVGLGAGAVTVAAGSPANQLSSDGIGKSNGDASSFPVASYAYNGGLRGRKRCCTVDKVVERRQRRMIKNRESAARSRARKQAYTVELEAEVAKLKEENEDLRKRTAELMEMQKNQVVEIMNMHQGGKRRCLRRTQSGQW